MKHLFCLLLVAALTGCSISNQVPVAEFEKDSAAPLPLISVFMKTPSEEFREDCEAFHRKSLLHHCHLNQLALEKFQDEMRAPAIFQDVRHADRSVDYRILVSTATYNLERPSELAAAVVAGATLMMAPMRLSADIHVDARLYWHGYELKTFTYEIPAEQRVSLLTLDQDLERDIARSIASHVLRDILQGDYFSPGYLARVIGSSDYEATLNPPEQVVSFEKAFLQVFNHPFLGARVRYYKRSSPGQFADVSVYPVRAGRLHNVTDLLRGEAASLRQDAELMQAEGELHNVSFSEDSALLWRSGDMPLELNYFVTNYSDTLGNEYVVRTYLTIVEDKFVRVQHFVPDYEVSQSEVDGFVSSLIDELRVPAECRFMARLRKQWRDSEPL